MIKMIEGWSRWSRETGLKRSGRSCREPARGCARRRERDDRRGRGADGRSRREDASGDGYDGVARM